MNTPEETARQIVPSRLRPGCVRISDAAGDAWVTLRDEDDINALRKLFERVVERARWEGAEEERARRVNLGAAVSTALEYLRSVLRYRDAAGITISPPQCERDLWEHVERAVDALRRVERT